MSAAQIDRLKMIGLQMEVELLTADLFDSETLGALKSIVIPIAEALNLDATPRDTGPPPLDAHVCLDDESRGWYGLCATCGIVTVMWEDRNIAHVSLTRHMESKHPSFEYVIKEMASS